MDGTERRGYGVIKNGSGTEFCTASAADNSCPNLELCNDFWLSAKYPLLMSRGNMQICIYVMKIYSATSNRIFMFLEFTAQATQYR